MERLLLSSVRLWFDMSIAENSNCTYLFFFFFFFYPTPCVYFRTSIINSYRSVVFRLSQERKGRKKPILEAHHAVQFQIYMP